MQQPGYVLFMGHGSPRNIAEDNSWTRDLSRFAQKLPRPEGVIAVSAHWRTREFSVTSAARSPQVFDFYGFDPELYKVRYEPPGHPDLSAELVRELGVHPSANHGLDHGTWAVARWLWPQADIPIVQLSLSVAGDQEHIALAQELLPWTARGFELLFSGNVVHNIPAADFYDRDANVPEALEEFDLEFAAAIGDAPRLLELRSHPAFGLAHPTDEHFVPALMAASIIRNPEIVHTGFQYRSVSMRSFAGHPG